MYPYIICGVTVTVTGVMFYILHCQNVLKKIGEQNASIEDKREDAPLNPTLVCFFAAVIINLFGIQSIDISFNSQIYTYARCIGISMSKSSQLTSVFWFAYGASRIVGIFGSKYLIPRAYILLAMSVGGIGSGLLFTEFLTIAVALIGFTIAIYCPSTISFASEWTRMSGKYMSVYAIGIASGGLITPLANSYLMELSFQSFIYTIVGCQVICWISFGSIWCLGKRLATSNKDKLLN